MRYKIIRLDRRYSYRDQFDYLLEFQRERNSGHVSLGPNGSGVYNSGVLAFDRARRWFNQQFGWSQDVVTRGKMITSGAEIEEINTRWAYSVAYDQYRLYVASDQELQWFLLAHPQT